LAQSDRTGQWVAAKARAGRDGPVPRYDRTVGTRQINPDLGTEGRPVRPGPHELDSQPMVAVPRVLKQNIMSPVAWGRATGLQEDGGCAIRAPAGEGPAMAFLEVPGPRRRGAVFEPPAAVVPEQQVRHQIRVRRPAGPEINIEESVVVQVAEVRAHRQDDPVQTELGGHVAEGLRPAAVARQARAAARRSPARSVAAD